LFSPYLLLLLCCYYRIDLLLNDSAVEKSAPWVLDVVWKTISLLLPPNTESMSQVLLEELDVARDLALRFRFDELRDHLSMSLPVDGSAVDSKRRDYNERVDIAQRKQNNFVVNSERVDSGKVAATRNSGGWRSLVSTTSVSRCPHLPRIDTRVESFDAEAFVNHFILGQRPCILTGLDNNWPLLAALHRSALSTQHADVDVLAGEV
jgi:hypothetical protein